MDIEERGGEPRNKHEVFAKQVSALLAGWVASQPGGTLPARVRPRSSSSDDRDRTTGLRNDKLFPGRYRTFSTLA
jgi:hypothetical protein